VANFYFIFVVSGDAKITNLVREYLQTKEKTRIKGRRYVKVGVERERETERRREQTPLRFVF
jgi:hypothetical protein